MTRVFDRALRRSNIEVAYSEGFNPHPKIAFGPPLPVGVEGEREYVDITIKTTSESDAYSMVDKVLEQLQKQLPEGIEIVGFSILPEGSKAIMAVINQACYRAEVPLLEPVEPAAFSQACENWLSKEEILSERIQKGKKVTRDIRPFIRAITMLPQESPNGYWLKLDIKTGNEGSVRPIEVFKSLASSEGIKIDMDGIYIIRDGVYILQDDGKQLSPLD